MISAGYHYITELVEKVYKILTWSKNGLKAMSISFNKFTWLVFTLLRFRHVDLVYDHCSNSLKLIKIVISSFFLDDIVSPNIKHAYQSIYKQNSTYSTC